MDGFLKSFFPENQKLKKEKLPGDGGHRLYTRVKAGKKSFMLMSCGKKDPSLRRFIKIQKRLAPPANVPQLFRSNLNQGLLLLEDLGHQSLEDLFFKKGPGQSLPFYRQAIKQMISFQSRVKLSPSDPLFDKRFFLKEADSAIYHLKTLIKNASQKARQPSAKEESLFKKDMEKILSNFKREDYAFCHRDFHSRNIMIKKGQAFLIDFQDAGAGPMLYDLASLLWDCYVPLSSSLKRELSLFYLKSLPPRIKKRVGSLSQLEFMAKLQFLQRGFKACGRFAAFKNENQKSSHLKYIPPTLSQLEKEARELAFSGFCQYIQKLAEALPPAKALRPKKEALLCGSRAKKARL